MVKNKINIKDLIIFMIPIIIFGIYLFIFYPGILSYDSYYQLNQIRTNTFSNWHPFLHTFIQMLCLKVWNSPASIGLFQIIVFSTIWGLICKYNRDENRKKQFILQIILTLFICINPINAIYSITLWKDILFTYAILAFCFIIQIIIDKKFKVNKYLLLLLTFIMAFISQIRYNGMFVMIVLISILIIILFLKDKKSKNYLIILIMFIGWMATLNSLNIIYNVEDNDKDALSTKIMHILAYYELKDYISDKDNRIIEKIIPKETLIDDYNPYFLDIIYDDTNHETAKKYKKNTVKMAVKYSLKHPIDCIKYVFKSSVITWNIVMPNDAIGSAYTTNIETVNKFDDINVKNINKKYYKTVNKTLSFTLNNKILYTIFYSGALYMYISLILLMILRKIFKVNPMYYLIILPVILNLLVLVMCIPVQDTRYVYPNFLVMYLIIAILINKLKIKNNNKKIEKVNSKS